LPTNLGKTYVDDTVKQMSRGFTQEQLSKPEFVKEMVTQLSPQEAFNLRHAVKNTMDAWVEGKQMPEFRQYAILQDALNGYIGEVAPAVRAAQKLYAESAQRAKFTGVLPVNKYGTPSIGRLGFLGAAGGMSAWAHSPLAGIMSLATTSPVVNAGARALTTGGLNLAEGVAKQSGNIIRQMSQSAKSRIQQPPTEPSTYTQPRISPQSASAEPMGQMPKLSPVDLVIRNAYQALQDGDNQKASDFAYKVLQMQPGNKDAIRLLDRLSQKGNYGYKVETVVKREKR
jgi:hypothetical protein